MKKVFVLVLVVLAVLVFGFSELAEAGRHGGGGQGYKHSGYVGAHYGGGGYHSGYHSGGYYGGGGVYFGPRAYWGPYYWGWPYYYPRPYSYPYYYPNYYNYPSVPVPPAPPVESQQQPNYWYFCQEPQGYYPYIKNCPGGWMKVVPNATPSPPPK